MAPAPEASSVPEATLPFLTASKVSGALPATGPRAGFDSGDRQTSGSPVYDGNGVKTGVWECQPGGWPIPTRDNTESCYILQGEVKVTGTGAEPQSESFIEISEWFGRVGRAVWARLTREIRRTALRDKGPLVKFRSQLTTLLPPTVFKKGDVFVMPKGWSGRWDVIQTVRKFYVIC